MAIQLCKPSELCVCGTQAQVHACPGRCAGCLFDKRPARPQEEQQCVALLVLMLIRVQLDRDEMAGSAMLFALMSTVQHTCPVL